jgi:hypothetical protein
MRSKIKWNIPKLETCTLCFEKLCKHNTINFIIVLCKYFIFEMEYNKNIHTFEKSLPLLNYKISIEKELIFYLFSFFSWNNTYHDTGSLVQNVSRYRVHDTIRITIQGQWYNTHHDTGSTKLYVSRYRVHETIRIAIQGSWNYKYRDTGFMKLYVSRYRVHETIRIAIQGSWNYTYHEQGSWNDSYIHETIRITYDTLSMINTYHDTDGLRKIVLYSTTLIPRHHLFHGIGIFSCDQC